MLFVSLHEYRWCWSPLFWFVLVSSRRPQLCLSAEHVYCARRCACCEHITRFPIVLILPQFRPLLSCASCSFCFSCWPTSSEGSPLQRVALKGSLYSVNGYATRRHKVRCRLYCFSLTAFYSRGPLPYLRLCLYSTHVLLHSGAASRDGARGAAARFACSGGIYGVLLL